MIDTTEPGETARLKERRRDLHELSAEELRLSTKLTLKFSSTRELAGVKDFVGQERGLAALELGLGVLGSGYNMFVSGLAGAEKLETLRRKLTRRANSCIQRAPSSFARRCYPSAFRRQLSHLSSAQHRRRTGDSSLRA